MPRIVLSPTVSISQHRPTHITSIRRDARNSCWASFLDLEASARALIDALTIGVLTNKKNGIDDPEKKEKNPGLSWKQRLQTVEKKGSRR